MLKYWQRSVWGAMVLHFITLLNIWTSTIVNNIYVRIYYVYYIIYALYNILLCKHSLKGNYEKQIPCTLYPAWEVEYYKISESPWWGFQWCKLGAAQGSLPRRAESFFWRMGTFPRVQVLCLLLGCGVGLTGPSFSNSSAQRTSLFLVPIEVTYRLV